MSRCYNYRGAVLSFGKLEEERNAMSRWTAPVGLSILGLILTISQPSPSAAVPVAKPAAPDPLSRTLEVLNTPHAFPEIRPDPQVKLVELLEKLSKDFSRPGDNPPFFLTFQINHRAFAAEGFSEDAMLDFSPIAEKRLPKEVNISVATRLRILLNRLTDKAKLNSGATFVIRKEHIEITTNAALVKEIWGGHPGPYLPLVYAKFEKSQLEDALKVLAEQSEHNIVLDARAGEKSKTAVTARFLNTPLDTAVAMLADMADLRTFLLDNVIYVTTAENALRWEGRQKKEMPPADGDTSPAPRIGPGVRGILPPGMSGGGGME